MGQICVKFKWPQLTSNARSLSDGLKGLRNIHPDRLNAVGARGGKETRIDMIFDKPSQCAEAAVARYGEQFQTLSLADKRRLADTRGRPPGTYFEA